MRLPSSFFASAAPGKLASRASAAFNSAAAARPDSDIDIAVKFGDGDPGLPRILEVQEEISGIFRGQEVDLSVSSAATSRNCASSIPPGWRPTWPIPKPPLFLVENGVRD